MRTAIATADGNEEQQQLLRRFYIDMLLLLGRKSETEVSAWIRTWIQTWQPLQDS